MVTKIIAISRVFFSENPKVNFLPNNLILPQCEMELERAYDVVGKRSSCYTALLGI